MGLEGREKSTTLLEAALLRFTDEMLIAIASYRFRPGKNVNHDFPELQGLRKQWLRGSKLLNVSQNLQGQVDQRPAFELDLFAVVMSARLGFALKGLTYGRHYHPLGDCRR